MSEGVINSPKGGGAVGGLGEKFSPDLFTGTGNFSVPIAVPAGRNGLGPELGLQYSTGSGNGPFGLGWNLGVPGVVRKTAKGVPQYDNGKDTFVLSGAEDLVAVAEHAIQDMPDALPGETGRAYQYRPRTEGLFARIYHYSTDRRDCWKVMSKNGLTSWYGSKAGRTGDLSLLSAPDGTGRIFGWKLTLTEDLFGSHILYSYEQEQVREDAYHAWSQSYLKEVRYADYMHNGSVAYMFRVAFTYEDRPDAFSEYKPGFEIRTTKRCREINIYNNPLTGELHTRTYRFRYSDEVLPLGQRPHNGGSLLCRVEVTGHGEDGSEALPPLDFTYTYFRPEQQKFKKLGGTSLPLSSLGNPGYEMVDLFGSGLPDIVEINGQVRYWRNLGEGMFDIPRLMKGAPSGFRLGDPDVQLADANGDGRMDLLVNGSNMAGYFSTKHDASWDTKAFKKYKYAPTFSLADPEVKMLDLTGDGITDALRNGSAFECFFHDKDNGWETSKRVPKKQLESFPDVSFADPRVKMADMTGDGLQDIVLVHSGNITYWPNLGYGNFAKPVRMKDSPRFPHPFDPARLQVADIDGDGQADLIYIDSNKVTFWINQSGNGWGEPFEITGTPFVTNPQGIRTVDLLGNGTAGVLYSFDAASDTQQHRWYFLDLTGGVKPYLLHEMDNSMGALTKVGYLPSTRYYLADQFGGDPFTAGGNRIYKNRKPWKTTLPFPVQVVSRVEVIDKLSRGKLTTEYLYHHGYWDGGEREFRGFGRVEQRDTESFTRYQLDGLHGSEGFNAVGEEHYAAPVETRNWFHLGPVGDEFGDWMEVDFSDEYWQEDPDVLRQDLDTFSLLQKLPRRAKRDAYRAWRGSSLRSELYAIDTTETSTGLTSKPYTVSESCYGIRLEAAPTGSPLLAGNVATVLTVPKETSGYIFFSFATGSRTTQWERGDDPMTQLSFTADFDRYGQPRKQLSVALSRGMRFTLEDGEVTAPKGTTVAAGDGGGPMLCTASVTAYAQRDDSTHYMTDRSCRATAYEIKPLYNEDVFALRDRVFGAALPTEVGHSLYPVLGFSINYYDAPAAFGDGLPYGQLGAYGALARTETLVLTDRDLQDAYGAGTEPVFFKPGLLTGADILAAGYPQSFIDNLQGGDLRLGYLRYEHSSNALYPTGWYAQSGRTKYDWQDGSIAKPRGLVLETKDIYGAWASIEYDAYQMLPVKATQYLYPYGGSGGSLETTAVYDYRSMQARMVTDPNGNRAVFGFSPLGLLKESGVIGKYGENEGDIIAESPLAYKPSVRMEYDFFAFVNGGNPVWVKTVQCEQHYQDNPASPEIAKVEYTDGFGRLLQARAQAEDILFGDGLLGGSGLPADQGSANAPAIGVQRAAGSLPNVIVSGWKVYNNKGKVVEQYEPYFDKGFGYDDAAVAVGEKVRMYYDPRGNVVRTVNPDGSEQWVLYGKPGQLSHVMLDGTGLPVPYVLNQQGSKIAVAGSPWESYTYDANDLAGAVGLPASGHEYTPASGTVDAMGRGIKAVSRLGQNSADDITMRYTYDIQGNQLKVNDAYGRPVFTNTFSISKLALKTVHIDGGTKHAIFDGTGKPIHAWDDKGGCVINGYDFLSRPRHLWAQDKTDTGMLNTVGGVIDGTEDLSLRQYIVYGDDSGVPTPAANNMLGKPYQHYDEAGLTQIVKYDFKGNPLEKFRRAISDATILTAFNGLTPTGEGIKCYRVDWESLDTSILDAMEYRSTIEYDALNRSTRITYPEDINGSRKEVVPSYNNAGALEKVSMDGTDYVKHIAYNARGQQLLVAYGEPVGNGEHVMVRFAYDAKTFRLQRVRAERYTYTQTGNNHEYAYNSGTTRYDQSYAYDLLGNVLAVNDRTPDCGLPATPDQLKRIFAYDSLYRLVYATGREDAATAANLYWQDPPQAGTPNANNCRAYVQQYGYDKLGNMLQLVHAASGNNYTRRYNYINNTNKADSIDNGQGTPTTLATFSYDANGNQAGANSDRHHGWDYADRMRCFYVEAGGSLTQYTHYLYDAAGARVKKLTWKNGGNITEAVTYIDGGFEYHTRDNLGAVEEKNYLQLQGGIEVRIGSYAGDGSEDILYTLSDYLSSAAIRLTANGSTYDREEYYPYGDSSLRTYGKKRYRFTGKGKDEESGLYYYGARYYCSWTAKFLTVDPLAPKMPGISPYAYANCSPLVFNDPTGMEPVGDPVVSEAQVNNAEDPPQASKEKATSKAKEINSLQKQIDAESKKEQPNTKEITENINAANTLMTDLLTAVSIERKEDLDISVNADALFNYLATKGYFPGATQEQLKEYKDAFVKGCIGIVKCATNLKDEVGTEALTQSVMYETYTDVAAAAKKAENDTGKKAVIYSVLIHDTQKWIATPGVSDAIKQDMALLKNESQDTINKIASASDEEKKSFTPHQKDILRSYLRVTDYNSTNVDVIENDDCTVNLCNYDGINPNGVNFDFALVINKYLYIHANEGGENMKGLIANQALWDRKLTNESAIYGCNPCYVYPIYNARYFGFILK